MRACRLLLTGFAPFAGWPRNPSQDAVLALARDASLRRAGVSTAVLPVSRAGAARELARLLRERSPEILVMTGLAAGRPAITIERTAVNCWRRAGDRGPGRPITEGPDGLFSTLPLAASLRALGSAGAPVAISETAGTYCCNLVLYLALLWSARGLPGGGTAPARAGFVHLPATARSLPPRRSEPCLSEEVLQASLRALCLSLAGGRPSRSLRRRAGTR